MLIDGSVLHVYCLGFTVAGKDGDFETAQCFNRDSIGCSEKNRQV